jgi:photosystem II protein
VGRGAQAAAVASAKTSMEFIKGTSESCVPEVKLTRARDGSSGTAVFFFESPDVFEAGVAEQAGGDITGLYLVDEEGTLSTVDVSAKFVNGKPKGIEARYTMKSAFEWDRFMRFMERYAEDHGAWDTRKRGAPCEARGQSAVGARGRRGRGANTRQAHTPEVQDLDCTSAAPPASPPWKASSTRSPLTPPALHPGLGFSKSG